MIVSCDMLDDVRCRRCRLFWSADDRFLSQFKDGDISTKFKSFSKYPPVFKDVTFWISDDFTENNLAEIARGAGAVPVAMQSIPRHGHRLPQPRSPARPCTASVLALTRSLCSTRTVCALRARLKRMPPAGGDLIEEVKLIDEFVHPKKGRTSNCFRITYRSMERSLTDDEINAIQNQVRQDITEELGVELR